MKPMVISLFDITGLVEPQVKFIQEERVPFTLTRGERLFAGKVGGLCSIRDKDDHFINVEEINIQFLFWIPIS